MTTLLNKTEMKIVEVFEEVVKYLENQAKENDKPLNYKIYKELFNWYNNPCVKDILDTSRAILADAKAKRTSKSKLSLDCDKSSWEEVKAYFLKRLIIWMSLKKWLLTILKGWIF